MSAGNYNSQVGVLLPPLLVVCQEKLKMCAKIKIWAIIYTYIQFLTHVQCNQAREQNVLKSHFWLKSTQTSLVVTKMTTTIISHNIIYRICRSTSRSYSTNSCCFYPGCVLCSEYHEFSAEWEITTPIWAGARIVLTHECSVPKI